MVDLMDAVETGTDVEAETPRRRFGLTVSNPRNWKPEDWRAQLPLLLVAFAVGFGAWLLRSELHNVFYANDATTHAAMSRLAERRMRAGHSPFDTWFAYEGLGSPQFLQYQALSPIVSGLLSIVFGGAVFRWANYLLICTWPISVYIGARLLGLDRWQAGAAALVSPMLVNIVGYGFEWGSFVWIGSGMWTMLWALWLMPIALGLAWRAVSRGEHYGRAAFFVGLTCAVHFITGYLVLLCVGMFVLLHPPAVLKRLGRSALVGLGALLTFAFVFVPTLANLDYVNVDSFQANTFWVNSYGPGSVFTWLYHGRIFDYQRHPVITWLVAAGIVVCLVRSIRNEAARVPLGIMALSLALYSGRGVVGPVIDHIPGGSDILLHRMIIGVHFAGMLLAGIGAVWAFRMVARFARFVLRMPGRNVVAIVIACVLAVVVMWPVLRERRRYAAGDRTYIESQQIAAQSPGNAVVQLIDIAKQRGGGRVYAGQSNGWGYYTKVGQIPLYQLLAQNDTDSLGFLLRTDSLSADVESDFNDANPALFDLFNVKYLLLPPGRSPSVKATEIKDIDGYSLWEVPTSGYLEVVDTTEAIPANRTNMFEVMTPYLKSDLVAQFRNPLVAFGGRSTPSPSTRVSAPYAGPPGRVDRSSDSLDTGHFEGQVTASRPAWVLLKESYAPHWTATVDGKAVKTAMLAPSFVGVQVPAGTHEVVFQYRSQSGYPLLLAVGALTLLGLAFGPRAWRRYRSRGTESGPEAPGPEPEPEPAPEPAAAS